VLARNGSLRSPANPLAMMLGGALMLGDALMRADAPGAARPLPP
jgi:hypothetical protein